MQPILATLGLLTLGLPALAGEIVVPNHAPTTAGPGGYSTLMHVQERSYQLVVGPEELGGLPVGSRITGITWRRPSWIVYGDWPGVGSSASYTNYDIYLSQSNNPPGMLSTTYTDNIGADVVQVRGGPLTLSGAFFPGGALAPNVNPLGQLIQFATPYVYKGGDLLLTIRHTGNAFTNGYLDTVSSPHYQAIGVSSYTQPDNWYNQGLITMKLEFEPGSTVYCTAKTNSCGSLPAISSSGLPSAGATSGFLVMASNTKAQKYGLLLYGDTGRASAPFSGGILCVNGPVKRSVAIGDSSGTPPGCDGQLAIDMNAFAAGMLGGNPLPSLSQPGTQVNCQFWGRDVVGQALLSDALEFVVEP